MQYQRPDSNNPANPLIKVAALTLNKVYVGAAPSKQVRIEASLNFKRSNDLRGQATTQQGEDVTVSFSLALKRASFELTVWSEDGAPAGSSVELRKVAFMSALSVKDKVEDNSSTTSGFDRSIAVSASGEGGVGLSGVTGTIKGKADAKLKAGSATQRKRKVSRSFVRSNITATAGGDRVHWEINPRATNGSAEEEPEYSYLEGEVFCGAKPSQVLDACLVKTKHGRPAATLIIRGSVFTSMQDLIIENVTFVDSLGQSKSWRELEESSAVSGGLFGQKLFNQTQAKDRILRQIIRKHLVSQGMKVEGSSVEICRAFT